MSCALCSWPCFSLKPCGPWLHHTCTHLAWELNRHTVEYNIYNCHSSVFYILQMKPTYLIIQLMCEKVILQTKICLFCWIFLEKATSNSTRYIVSYIHLHISIERDSIVSVFVVMREFKKVGLLGRSPRPPNGMKILCYKSHSSSHTSHSCHTHTPIFVSYAYVKRLRVWLKSIRDT